MYNLLVNPPKEIFVKKEEFLNFSYIELASFMCNYPVVFLKKEDESIEIYTNRYNLVDLCLTNYRFKNIVWYENQKAELCHCNIPQDNKMNKFIKNKLTNLILK